MFNFSNKIFRRDVELIDKTHFIIIIIVRFTLLFAVVGSLISQRWTVLFVSAATFALTYLPNLFEKKYKIEIPVEFEIITVLFIFATLFLGEVHGYYTKYWWWDIILHTGSAIAFGFIGFTILFILYKGDKIKASPITIAVFSFFFAIGIGAIWEIFEFSMDQLFGFSMQKNGLVDTMWDLIVDSIGALIASVSGYFYIKSDGGFIFNKIMDKFIRENPKYFNKLEKENSG